MTPPSHPPSTIVAETVDFLMACWEVLQDNAMNLVVAFDGRLDVERLRHAMRLSLDVEPVLGCRFSERWYRPVWVRREDLDELELCRLEHPQDPQASIRRFLAESLDAERDCQIRAELWRGATDTLGFKLSHKVGDGRALMQYAYRLAEIYNRLASDPAFRPAPNPRTDRSLRQVIPPRRREPSASSDHEAHKGPRRRGRWRQSADDGTPREPRVCIRRLDEHRYASVFDYACRRRATVFHVLMGALFLGARETMPHTEGETMRVGSIVDLRRYVADPNALPLCNLFGMLGLWIEPGRAESLDQVLDQVREQMLAKRRTHLTQTAPAILLDAHPVARRVWKCVPYRWVKAYLNLTMSRRRSGIVLLTDIGPLEADRLEFDGLGTTEAFVASGMIHNPNLSIFCVSSFRNTMTICTGISHAGPEERLLDQMLEALPD